MNKTIASAIALMAIIGSVFGAYFYIDNKYALSQELKRTEQRLEGKIISDQLNSVQDRIWKIEDRYDNKIMDSTVKEEYRKLQQQKIDLNNDLNNINKSVK
jgi:hypothetical protein